MEGFQSMSQLNDLRPATHHSRLAALQGLITLSIVLMSMVLTAVCWSRSNAGALWLGLLILLGHAPVLMLELMLVSSTHTGLKKLKPRFSDFATAWWQEVCQVPLVFAWRQPFCWRRFPDTVRTVPAQPSSAATSAVIFIHGFMCNRGFWLPWMRHLRLRGVSYLSMNLEPILSDIDALVPQLERVVQHAETVTGKKPFLFCHSMGGLVARAWIVAAPGNARRVQWIVTIGTPHHGTWLARWAHTASGRQMRLDSSWLKALQSKEVALQPTETYENFTCWYSNTDNVVFPSDVATLAGADNRLVPGAAHVALAFHPIVIRESLAIIESGSSSPMARTAS